MDSLEKDLVEVRGQVRVAQQALNHERELVAKGKDEALVLKDQLNASQRELRDAKVQLDEERVALLHRVEENLKQALEKLAKRKS